jgi:hypothetical protein
MNNERTNSLQFESVSGRVGKKTRKVIQQNPMNQKKNQKPPRNHNSQPPKANQNDSDQTKQIPVTDKSSRAQMTYNEHIQEGTKLSALR